jgi:hypothetical protein
LRPAAPRRAWQTNIARSAELQAEYSTLAPRLESPISRAVYIVFAVEINGRRIENTTALYDCSRA